jgi:hypothetical protein
MIPIGIPSPKLASSYLPLPVFATHTNKKAREIRAFLRLLPVTAGGCQPSNYSHSIVPGGLPVTS